MPEYALTEFWIYLGFCICQDSEYDRAMNMQEFTQGSKYATTWLNMSKWDVNMPEYVW